ncbi:MAG TPA: hypothetical protein PK034_11065 [Rugosibacter sp.]|nr:hypothetical protein [Rugosibacter sp.]
MTTITIERATLDRLIDAWDSTVLPKSRDGMMQERMEDLRSALAAPATAPESGVMTEIDYNDDDALRFVQRVLESDAPLSDIRDARNMVVEIRTRVLKARASKPATAPEPICTKCGDVITAHDPGLCGCCLSTRDATSPEQKDRPINCGTGHCSCIECVMLFNG